ncbi:MAG: molybdopterin converting factor subunit 1 [Betaproteobacteria bacterium]|nr:molybdopterin converting factor subunit 1 [Betaproteobacteria bacterium]
MALKVLYFASLREALGTAAESFQLPAGIATVGALRAHLEARGDAWAALGTTRNLRAAVNQRIVGPDACVADGDEVAFFPPVTGG